MLSPELDDVPVISHVSVVHRLMLDVWEQGRLETLPDLVHENFVGHLAIGDHYGPHGARIEVSAYRSALPDLSVSVDDVVSDGSKVARRFTLRGTHLGPLLGIPASGAPVVLRGLAIDRFEDGKIIESWVQVEQPA
jgi:steroid delta-isomerase-like uncharacterized protein